MHPVDGDVMHLCFGLGNPVEDRAGGLSRALGQRRVFQKFAHRAVSCLGPVPAARIMRG